MDRPLPVLDDWKTDDVRCDYFAKSLLTTSATGYEPFGRLTVSNNEFDGATPNSATCNGFVSPEDWEMVLTDQLALLDYALLWNW